jgi:hypothetical protein
MEEEDSTYESGTALQLVRKGKGANEKKEKILD